MATPINVSAFLEQMARALLPVAIVGTAVLLAVAQIKTFALLRLAAWAEQREAEKAAQEALLHADPHEVAAAIASAIEEGRETMINDREQGEAADHFFEHGYGDGVDHGWEHHPVAASASFEAAAESFARAYDEEAAAEFAHEKRLAS